MEREGEREEGGRKVQNSGPFCLASLPLLLSSPDQNICWLRESQESQAHLYWPLDPAPLTSQMTLPTPPPPSSCSSLITLGASTTLAFAHCTSSAQRRLPLVNPPGRNVYSLTLWDSAQGSGPVSLAISFPQRERAWLQHVLPPVPSTGLHSHSHLVSPSESNGYWQGNPQHLPHRHRRIYYPPAVVPSHAGRGRMPQQ